MAKGCVYIPQTGKDAGKVFGSKESLAAHMNYTPAMADVMAKYQQTGGAMDVGSVTKWLTDNGYLKAEAKKPTTEAAPKPTTAVKETTLVDKWEKAGLEILNKYGVERFTDWLSNQPLLSEDGFYGIRDIANKYGIKFPQTKKEFDAEVKKNGGIDSYMGSMADTFMSKMKQAPVEKKPTVKKEFPKAPVTDAVKAALKNVDNTTAAIMNLAKVLPTVYESITKQVKITLGKPVSQQVAEAYHSAVENGVEPELVAAVENAVALQEQMKSKPSLADNIETAETLEVAGVPNGVRVSNKSSLADLERKHAGNATKKATIAMARAAAKTLKSVFPMMDIHLHENTADYNNTMAGLGAQQGSAGNFTYTTSADGTVVGRIDINLNRAVPRTVVHEVSHAIMLKTFGDSSPAFLEFRNNLEKIISKSGNARLSAFADKYKDIADDIGQAEEYLAELAGILSDKEAPLSYGVIRRIAELINKMVSTITFGRLKPFEDLQNQKETLEFFNTMAQNIKAGQEYDINSMGLHGEIKATGIKSKASISSGEIMGFEVNPNTKVEDDVPLSRFNGKVTNLIESDRMVGGYIADEKGNPLFKFFGGVKFPEITGKWWASRTDSKAKGIAQNANKNRDADGYIYSSPMIGSETQHMSNADMMFATIELMKEDVKNKKSKVTKNDVVAIMDKALGRVMLKDKKDAFKSFFKAKNITEMFNELEFILFQEGTEKGDFLVDKNGKPLLTEGEKKIPIFSFEERLAIVETLLGDPKVKEPRFPMAGSITDTAKRFTEPVSGRAKKIGDLVMIMRTKGTLKHKKTPTTDPFYHKSYPYEIYAENEDGTPAKVEVFFLDGAYSMQDVLPELKKSNGEMFSYQEYAEKHAAKTAAYVEAQYNRTAKLAYASGEIKSKAQVVYDETGFITTDSMIEIVKANDPTYLGDVMNHILDMGEKLRSGNVGPKDLAKAYMMAVSSIRSGDLGIDKFENAIGQKVDEVFVEKERGKIRTEGAMAYLLTTPQGQRMLNNISNGKIDAKDRAFISQAMKPFGMFGEGESKFDNLFGAPSNKQINLTNINEFADMLKGGVKNEQELFNAIANLKGISQAKVGFVSNFLGIGTRGVIDAREIQGWMRGVVFQGERTEKEAALEKELLKSNKNLTPLQKEILRRMRVVGDAFNVEPIISEYIGHHMIWDAVKNERTTHDGLYLAMKQNEDDFNNRLAEIKAKPELKTKAQMASVEETAKDLEKVDFRSVLNPKTLKDYSAFTHQTDEKSANSIIKNGFRKDKNNLWVAPDDTASYGDVSMEVFIKLKNPFILDRLYEDKNGKKLSNKEISKNRALYDSLGGEANDKSFDKLREMGYDTIIEDNGDIATLYPEDAIFLDSPISISEAYQKAKEDGSNPELVKAVEELVGKPGLKTKAQMVDNNAKQVADLYAEMREGGGWAERQKINAILDQDPKLSYIYNNFKAITQMLEDAKLLTKSGNCP